MGTPDDLGRLRAVLELLAEHDLPPRRVTVGDIAVEIATQPHASAGEAHTYEPVESDREREEREKREFEAIMYAASEGPDFS